jgi:hypothetical protein
MFMPAIAILVCVLVPKLQYFLLAVASIIFLNQLLDLVWQEKNPRFRESGDSDDDEEDDRKRRG